MTSVNAVLVTGGRSDIGDGDPVLVAPSRSDIRVVGDIILVTTKGRNIVQSEDSEPPRIVTPSRKSVAPGREIRYSKIIPPKRMVEIGYEVPLIETHNRTEIIHKHTTTPKIQIHRSDVVPDRRDGIPVLVATDRSECRGWDPGTSSN